MTWYDLSSEEQKFKKKIEALAANGKHSME